MWYFLQTHFNKPKQNKIRQAVLLEAIYILYTGVPSHWKAELEIGNIFSGSFSDLFIVH